MRFRLNPLRHNAAHLPESNAHQQTSAVLLLDCLYFNLITRTETMFSKLTVRNTFLLFFFSRVFIFAFIVLIHQVVLVCFIAVMFLNCYVEPKALGIPYYQR